LNANFQTEFRDGVLHVRHGGRKVLDYRHAPVCGPAGVDVLLARSAYIHPLQAPCGVAVTDDFPADHPHQRGVFFAWTKTLIKAGERELHPDFWNLGNGTGRIRSVKVECHSGDKEALRIHATHLWEACRNDIWEPVLEEAWQLVVHFPGFRDCDAEQAWYVLDITSRQIPLTPLALPEHRYGGMAIRGARGWIEDGNGYQVSTSEGLRGAAANATRARWVDMSGEVEGKRVGVALLDHPSNLRAPNPLRVPNGLPYCVYSPSQAGALALRAGEEIAFRYRIVVHNSLADAQALEREWRRFAGPTKPRPPV
jgi:hypothetical protein